MYSFKVANHTNLVGHANTMDRIVSTANMPAAWHFINRNLHYCVQCRSLSVMDTISKTPDPTIANESIWIEPSQYRLKHNVYAEVLEPTSLKLTAE